MICAIALPRTAAAIDAAVGTAIANGLRTGDIFGADDPNARQMGFLRDGRRCRRCCLMKHLTEELWFDVDTPGIYQYHTSGDRAGTAERCRRVVP